MFYNGLHILMITHKPRWNGGGGGGDNPLSTSIIYKVKSSGTTSIEYPSGSFKKAKFFILP